MLDWVALASIVVAIFLDACFGEPSRWHPLVGFGNLANVVQRCLNKFHNVEKTGAGPDSDKNLLLHESTIHRVRGLLAWVLLVVPFVLLSLLIPSGGLAWIADAAILYWAIGRHSLKTHARQITDALTNNNLVLARKRMGLIVSRETHSMSEADIARGTVESVLENGNDAIFGAIFWFLVAGAPGVILFRLANTLDAMWGYRNARFYYFGWAAARLDDLLNWIPARLTALAYALVGQRKSAMAAWRDGAPQWDSPNAGPVMASGAGSLQIMLGGPACYDGEIHSRAWLGVGRAPESIDITRALHLLDRALLVWLLVLIFWVGISDVIR